MKSEYELKFDWNPLGGPESDAVKPLPAGTKVGVIETTEDGRMTPQQLADAVVRGLVGEVHKPEPEPAVEGDAAAGRRSGRRAPKDE